jgi:hypothetical protein
MAHDNHVQPNLALGDMFLLAPVILRGEFPQNFDLKHLISTYVQSTFNEKWLKIARFWRKKNCKLPDLYDTIQYVAKNIEGCLNIFVFICYIARFGLFFLQMIASAQNWKRKNTGGLCSVWDFGVIFLLEVEWMCGL